MIRLAVSTEGFTEHESVRSVIAPYLWARCGIEVQSIMLETRRLPNGRKFRGGTVAFDKMVAELRRLLNSFDFVTTMYDFYGFRLDGSSANSPADVTNRLSIAIGNDRFIPYVQVHEFEALLFADTDATAAIMGLDGGASQLDRIVSQYGTPEGINTRPETIPSAQLSALFPPYDKTLHGPLALMQADLSMVRQKCPAFGAWLGRLEQLTIR